MDRLNELSQDGLTQKQAHDYMMNHKVYVESPVKSDMIQEKLEQAGFMLISGYEKSNAYPFIYIYAGSYSYGCMVSEFSSYEIPELEACQILDINIIDEDTSGYEANVLTWQDVKNIVTIADDIMKNTPRHELVDMGEEEYYRKILDRYLSDAVNTSVFNPY